MFRRLLLLLTDPDLRLKLIQVLGLLVVARLLAYIPIPIFKIEDISSTINSDAALGLLNTISGGSYGQLSFVMLGVGPFITASIVMQLLGVIIPQIRDIQRNDGEAGQQKINRWTRYLSIPLSALSAWGILQFLANGDVSGSGSIITLPSQLDTTQVDAQSIWYWFVVIGSMTAGSAIIMWIGEIITEMKMGNGISMLILTGIIARLPKQLYDYWRTPTISKKVVESFSDIFKDPNLFFKTESWNNFWSKSLYWEGARSFFFLIFAFLLMLGFVVFINDAVRKVLVVYSQRGHKEGKSRTLGNVKADLPIKVNIAGVLPIIFAVSFILFPTILGRFLVTSNLKSLAKSASKVETYLSTQQNTDYILPNGVDTANQKFVYTKDESKVKAIEEFDPNTGEDILGFTFSTEKDLKNKFFKNTFMEFTTKTTDFGFLPEFTVVFKGFLAYTFFYFLLIIFFTYFYTSTIAFKTDEVAENLQRSGAYIPGYRPGFETEQYLSYISNRLNVVGSIFLAVIAVIPFVFSNTLSNQQNSGLMGVVGGTTLLILVSVTIETLKQLEAQATSIDYERFTKY
jgi:preprotein translocase SecY subunit